MEPRRILGLDAALSRASIAILDGEEVATRRDFDGPHGVAETLPVAASECLAEAGLATGDLDAIAVSIGPGSFTGLRASIALAQGLGFASGMPVHGISLTEAFMAAMPDIGGRTLWIAVTARRGRIFLEREGRAEAFPDEGVPRPEGPVALAGDRAIRVAARLAARGHDVMLTGLRYPDAARVALAARARILSGLPPRPAAPLYVDPPEAKLPAGRSSPAAA
ncbi:MAG TPA: tRNA (adenosine(37)-N6)-threonylcarbamoyltransferase complex dimerization subunit type 1 TsaB [Acetobacteraceae bacterium]|nr:tRNA (adenosine(37)-N6)-threonylcarbamoyltransferase complex dimerization subunit type 1 TsaB [Acetobacteraceae bacterium]